MEQERGRVESRVPAAQAERAKALSHAPRVGWAKRLLGRFHVTGVFWYRIHAFGMRILPRWAVGIVVTLFTTFFFCLIFNIRRAIAGNLEAVLGPCGWLERQLRIYRTFFTFAWCLSERYERLHGKGGFAIDIDLERWRGLFAPGTGFVMVTAHLGNFEVGSMLPAFEEARDVHVVREREAEPEAQAFIERLLADAGGSHYVSHFEGEDELQGLALLNALRVGGIVGVQGDRPRSGGRIVPAMLFGRPFPLPDGPATLARVAEVPLVPIFVLRVARRRYRIEIRDPIRVARSGRRDRDVAEAMQRVADEIEWAIRQAPHQWFCFREVWPPEGQSR